MSVIPLFSFLAPPRGLPKIIENPTTAIGQVGDSTHLQCEVAATPSASVVWIKDTTYPIDLSDPRYRLFGNSKPFLTTLLFFCFAYIFFFQLGSGSLVIESLLEEDSGVYECMARNIIGTAISSAGTLNVRRKLSFH